MLIRYGYDITLTFPQPTPLVCLLTVSQDRAGDLRVPEHVTTIPANLPATSYRDAYGNHCRRLIAPAGDFSIRCDATLIDAGVPVPASPAAREVPVAALPDDCLVYLLGSRYCETDKLSQIAWDLFGATPPGWGRVQAVCDFVHKHIKFDYMQARATRTAYEGFMERTGVCRDYAHLAIALLRCLNIPARYINGYLGDIGVPVVDPMDFSAWIEVFLEGGWYTFDPRNNVPRIGRIVVARGRDATDVPLFNSFGPHTLKSFYVWTYALEDSELDAVRNGKPVSPPKAVRVAATAFVPAVTHDHVHAGLPG
jgi:transglutaminase-like putative cysteine protease